MDINEVFSGRISSAQSLENPALDAEVQQANGVLSDQAESEYERLFALRLGQILSYLVGQGVDVAVFPESAVPPSALKVLTGFREQIATFAGVGIVREVDLQELKDAGLHGADSDLIDRNIAIYVDGSVCQVVTKANPAHQEVMQPGNGSETVTLRRRDRSYHIGLRICMDHLQAPSAEDVCLVSAFSAGTSDFRPKTPRNLLVLANHATPGGSFIAAAHLDAPSFADETGTLPLPARTEGICVVDWSGDIGKPTPLRAPSNRLLLRSAIVYSDGTPRPTEQGTAEVVRKMRDWQSRDLASSSLGLQLKAALDFLTLEQPNQILIDSLKYLFRAAMGDCLVTSHSLPGIF